MKLRVFVLGVPVLLLLAGFALAQIGARAAPGGTAAENLT
jgi:hypothetical protein